jgi:3-dehydroquinate synthase
MIKYDILIGTGLLDGAGATLREKVGGETAAIISDDIVFNLCGNKLIDSLQQSGYHTVEHVFPNGEQSKNADTFLSILNFLAENKITKTDVVIALGGGVVGDMAGFCAACFKRGVPYAQIPTTLLSMVDSSVGGKTAINLPTGKNLAGAFYQPSAVICDVSLLSSLPSEQMKDGYAEIIKYGMISDRELFDSLKTPIDSRLEQIITRCVEIKRDIVTEDEFENGVRKLLNFGHTIGHAIEVLSGYGISHGHAVAIGMAVETRIATALGICDNGCLNELLDILHKYGLPCETNYGVSEITEICLSDKKREGGSITMIFPSKVGECVMKNIVVSELEAVITKGLE